MGSFRRPTAARKVLPWTGPASHTSSSLSTPRTAPFPGAAFSSAGSVMTPAFAISIRNSRVGAMRGMVTAPF